eukprot:TRINITY_DN10696_c0_g1_i1.p1 TRINITY_DN10696_c0_g1~~TRINITY_DN10696_c0_g1_i1.p1  ORF type:complete len:308 (-),score=66.32 TRINITY_DN10696_c0_g1_i1:325-1248(-)
MVHSGSLTTTLLLQSERRCNGHAELCRMRVNEASWAASHNTMSSLEDHFVAPDNYYGVKAALENGVRVLMLDLWPYNGTVYLCHQLCMLGRYPWTRDLRTIREFLRTNTSEVVMVVIEQYAESSKIIDLVIQEGLGPYLYQPSKELVERGADLAGFQWPTLGELIDTNQRLLIFSDERLNKTLRYTYPWYMFVWDFMFETWFQVASPSNFSCLPWRGHLGGVGLYDDLETYARYRDRYAVRLSVLNHFVTAPVATPVVADTVNRNPFLITRAKECREAWLGHQVNLVTVDFWSQGDLIAAVGQLNNV